MEQRVARQKDIRMARGRRRASGGEGRKKKTISRVFETYEKKLDVLNHLLLTNDMSKTLDEFYGDLGAAKRETKRKLIYMWQKQRSMIEHMCASTNGALQRTNRATGTATVISRRGEEIIKLWINSVRSEGVPVSSMMLRIKARQVADDEGVSEGLFTGAWSWRQAFLKRHGLAFRARTRQGQRTPPDMEAAATEFWASVERVKTELGVSRVYNADQSGISFEYLPRRTVNSSGEKTVWVRCSGKEKERFTGMFLADSEGNQYAPFFVLRTVPPKNVSTAQDNTTVRRGFGARLWKDIHALSQQTGAQIFGNRCGWWNTELTVEFLDFHFANRLTDGPVLLLLDDFSAHWTEAAANHALDLNVYLLKVPPGLTSVCQPADVSWFGPMKRRLRDEWVQFLMQQLRVYDGRATGAAFRLHHLTRSDAIQWACKAWSTLGSKVIKSGFKCQTKRDEESEPYRDELVERLQSLLIVNEELRDSDDVLKENAE